MVSPPLSSSYGVDPGQRKGDIRRGDIGQRASLRSLHSTMCLAFSAESCAISALADDPKSGRTRHYGAESSHSLLEPTK
jgi:hypothetical protein